MKFKQVFQRHFIIISAMILLGIASYIILTPFSDKTQNQLRYVDAAGRQRMLSQRMAFSAEKIIIGHEDHEELQKSMNLFDKTLIALHSGGEVPGMDYSLAPNDNPDIVQFIDEVVYPSWKGYQHSLEIILNHKEQDSSMVQEAIRNIESSASSFLSKNNELVQRFSTLSIYAQERMNNIILLIMIANLVGLIFIYLLSNQYHRERAKVKRINKVLSKTQNDLKNSLLTVQLQNKELEKKIKELDQFTHVVSHDLKAPLRAISTLSDFLAEDLSEGCCTPEVKKHLDLIKSRTFRMQTLIIELLEYTKIEFNKEDSEVISLQEMMNECIGFVDIPANFNIEVSPSLSKVYSNKLLISQVFNNLISNAIKYNHQQKGELKIWQEMKDGNLLLHFSDNGPGIASQFHQKIFEIFQTLGDTKTDDSTGIGLSTVKKIINQLELEIKVESEVGKGSDFIVVFPEKYVVE